MAIANTDEQVLVQLRDKAGNPLAVTYAKYLLDVLPVELGGTGGTTAEEARTNLEIYSKAEVDTQISNVEAGETKDITALKERVDEVEKAVEGIPTQTSELTNTGEDGSSRYATEAVVDKKIAEAHSQVILTLVGAVDTYDELPTSSNNGDIYLVLDEEHLYVWIGSKWYKLSEVFDSSLFTSKEEFEELRSIVTSLSTTVTSLETEIKSKADESKVTELESALENKADRSEIPTSTSQLTNDSGYITSSALDGYATSESVTSAISSASATLQTEIDKKADSTTVGDLSGAVEDIEATLLTGVYFEIVEDD